jgi:sugar phosphate isomerase/epimerase
MMTAPIALQLYSIREQLEGDFRGTMEKVAAMGYAAVETGQFAGDPEQQIAVFDDLGLRVIAAHVKPPVGENKNSSLDFMEVMGSDRLVVPWLDPKVYFSSAAGVQQAADLLNESAVNSAERGLQLHYHNHDFEFGRIDGRLAFDLLYEKLDPKILFEIDTYWVETAGIDSAELIRELEQRAPLLHIKDGLLDRELPMVAVGDGRMDFKKVIPAGAPHTRWLIVELDRCAGDMMHAVARSLDYLQEFARADLPAS